QRQYTLDILAKFNMADCRPVGTPLDPGAKLSTKMSPTTDAERASMKDIPYINAVGALMYLATATRPDIANTVSTLARFSSNPGMAHWNAVKHLMRYLQGTLDMKLTYSPNSEFLSVYSDADHAGNLDNGKSTSGYVLKIGSGAVSWSSKLQTMVGLSTTEAEYVAAVTCGMEAIWMRSLLSEIGYTQDGPTLIYMDNQSAIQVVKNPEHHGRMKHLDLRLFWLRDEIQKGVISVKYIPTDFMAADILTKPLSKVKVVEAYKQLELQS
ncbi:hypothetical protein EUX98_g6049, partial [Antrodiella citrinella]